MAEIRNTTKAMREDPDEPLAALTEGIVTGSATSFIERQERDGQRQLEAPPVAPERAHDFPAGLVDLAVMLSDLDGFIERRAAELAKPEIERGTEGAVRADERRKCAEEIRTAAQGIDTLGLLMLVRAATLDAADIIDPPARKETP